MTLPDKTYLQINQALFSLTHAYETRMEADADNTAGLSLSDCSVLMVLHQFAPTTAARLSEIMDINPGTISVYVQRLTKNGLVRREQDPDDLRNWRLTLSEPGNIVASAVVAAAADYTRAFLAALDEEEQATLHRLLLKASHSLGFDWQ
ncbi:MAG TPA: MarR family transcriptional regulator [Anaerolineae bacterium]|nr:MarR family transcriptional regulator [Anaerolineae bacterium]